MNNAVAPCLRQLRRTEGIREEAYQELLPSRQKSIHSHYKQTRRIKELGAHHHGH